jgi:hypothetical protein
MICRITIGVFLIQIYHTCSKCSTSTSPTTPPTSPSATLPSGTGWRFVLATNHTPAAVNLIVFTGFFIIIIIIIIILVLVVIIVVIVVVIIIVVIIIVLLLTRLSRAARAAFSLGFLDKCLQIFRPLIQPFSEFTFRELRVRHLPTISPPFAIVCCKFLLFSQGAGWGCCRLCGHVDAQEIRQFLFCHQAGKRNMFFGRNQRGPSHPFRLSFRVHLLKPVGFERSWMCEKCMRYQPSAWGTSHKNRFIARTV